MPDTGDYFEQIYSSSRNSTISPMNGQDSVLPFKDGAPGFAKAIGRNYERYTYAFAVSGQMELGTFASKPMGNLFRDLFKEIGPKLIRLPHATRFPLEPKGQKGWSELVDPISLLIPESAVPLGPISPDTRQRKLIRVQTGKRGIASHLNIIVDTSGSMGDGTTYGFIQSSDGRTVPGGGRFSTRWVAQLLIAQAKQLGDSFSLFTFAGNTVRSITRGASRSYEEAINWLNSEDDDFVLPNGGTDLASLPFPSGGGTPLDKGLAACASTMNQNRRKIAGALTIAICDGEPNGGLRCILNGGSRNDYVKSWKDNGEPEYDRDYNPNNDPRLFLNDAYLRRNFGPVLYVMVGGTDDESGMQRLAKGISAELQNFYNGTNYGAAQRSRDVNGETEYQTILMLGNDPRINRAEGGWSPWTWVYNPTYGQGVAAPPRGSWSNPGMRGPCDTCGISFTIASGMLGLETFGGSLLALARAGKGGELQSGCFTKAKSSK